MSERLSPLEALRAHLDSFIEQSTQPVSLLTCFDEEVPTIVRVIHAIDGESPGDVVFFHCAPVGGAAAYVDGFLGEVLAQLAEANDVRREAGEPLLSGFPTTCSARAVDPYERLRVALAHMTTWMPPDEEHRLVVALLPERIDDRETYARVAGTLVPFGGYEPWMRGVRLVLRDDRRVPFVVDALRRAGVHGPILHTTRVTVADLADSVALDAADPKLPPARRMNALLQCAALDVALGRYESAIHKYGTLYHYYDIHRVLELKAMVLQGLGDVMARLARWSTARDHYLRALDLASDVGSLTLILHSAIGIGDIDMRLEAYAEADTSFTLGAGAADKLGNIFARADLLEKAGEARSRGGDLRGATESWTAAAAVARDAGYEERLGSVLVRLRDLSLGAGYSDLAKRYDAELSTVKCGSSCGARGRA